MVAFSCQSGTGGTRQQGAVGGRVVSFTGGARIGAPKAQRCWLKPAVVLQ